ncbi:hypothetical protein GOBAR_AA09069 [Gossypium barbadense]|uniref:Uncharacterized protein n=1 Tax=Gossypium barbadense TaxID=3634 RepID=A0A2P5Y7M8_GOSBA|nr:hypothetical protein GOBAR_AA09069 [Gossypium barbadense]
MKVKADRDEHKMFPRDARITALYIKLRTTGGNKTKTPGSGAQSALRALACSGMKIGRIEDVTPIPTDSTRRVVEEGESYKLAHYVLANLSF